MHRSKGVQALPQLNERIGRLEFAFAPFTANRDLLVVRDQLPKRLNRQKTVAPDLFAADDALEQARLAARVEQVKRRHGRKRVAEQPAIDWNELVPVGQAAKGLEIRQMSHGATVACSRRAKQGRAHPPATSPAAAAERF